MVNKPVKISNRRSRRQIMNKISQETARKLLEACKSMIKTLQKEKLTQYVNFHVRKQMREAIAEAENNVIY